MHLRLRPPLAMVVFVVGFSVLGAEIAAARLLAPYFGASTVVWANTIGVVLVSLSAGYWLGGALADRNPTPGGLHRLVLLAGVLLAAVPYVAHPLLTVAVDALDAVSAGAFLGSLLGVLAVVAVPVFVSGAVTPYALRLAITDISTSGQVSGRLSAWSTAGGLVGTFTSALLLIPFAGTRRTFLVFAVVLVVVAAFGLRRRWPAAIAVVLLIAISAPTAAIKSDTSRAGARVIFETETEYQYARVVQRRDGSRQLELNEGQAVHSVRRPGLWLTGGIWDDLAIMPFAGRATPPQRIAILGNAAGSAARIIGRYFPATRIDGVEIDGELTDIGRRYFDMRAPGLSTHTQDGRVFLRRTQQRYDTIMVDAYRQPYIPFHLTTREFFDLARSRLRPGGRVIVNVGHPEGNNDLERALTATLSAVFPRVDRYPAKDINTLLLASDRPLTARQIIATAGRLPAAVRQVALGASEAVAPGLDGGEVFTDDRAPVEWLIDASIVQVAASGERGR